MRFNFKRLLFIILLVFITLSCACSGAKDSRVDKDNPIRITLWHDFNGVAQVSLDRAVLEFNNTLGYERGIIVVPISLDYTEHLENQLIDSAKGLANSKAMPNIFFTSADTAYILNKLGKLSNLSDHLTEAEKNVYFSTDSKEEFFIDGGLKAFPLFRNTKLLYVNKTDWETFSSANGLSMDQLDTWEGLFECARLYYQWTDSQTPDIAGDGKAFLGVDSLTAMLSLASRAHGVAMIETTDEGTGEIILDANALETIWNLYYTGRIMNYIRKSSRYPYNDIKTKDVICYAGSSIDSGNFPTSVVDESGEYEIELLVRPYPSFDQSSDAYFHQDLAMSIKKGTVLEEVSGLAFLEWFADNARSFQFFAETGYTPAQKDILKSSANIEAFEALRKSGKKNANIYLVNAVANLQVRTQGAIHSVPFENSLEAGRILEHSLDEMLAIDIGIAEGMKAEGIEEEQVLDRVRVDQRYKYWISLTKKRLQDKNITAY